MCATNASLRYYRTYLIFWLLVLIGAACTQRKSPALAVPAATLTHTVVRSTSAPSFSSTHTLAPSSTPTVSQTPTDLPTATPAATYTFLRGEVNVEHANCRYGPGAAYLYKYGLVGGSNLELLGRMDIMSTTGPATWIFLRAIGGDNPCWVNASLLNVKGDINNLAPINVEEVVLPQSPNYGPVTGVYAARSGSEVTISWNEMSLKAGDDSEQFPYLIETWVCRGGQLFFSPVGSYALAITIQDDSGCLEPSHGRLYAVEKHGYTKWVEIPWPPKAGTTPSP